MTTEFEVGGRYRYSGNGYIVTLIELLPNDRAIVYWTTTGRRQPGRRFWLVAPQERKKTVRLSSLSEF